MWKSSEIHEPVDLISLLSANYLDTKKAMIIIRKANKYLAKTLWHLMNVRFYPNFVVTQTDMSILHYVISIANSYSIEWFRLHSYMSIS